MNTIHRACFSPEVSKSVVVGRGGSDTGVPGSYETATPQDHCRALGITLL